MKSLSINEFEAECIPSADLVRMLVKMAEKQEKPVEVVEVQAKGEGWIMKLIGKVLLIGGGLYMVIHLLAWWVKT